MTLLEHAPGLAASIGLCVGSFGGRGMRGALARCGAGWIGGTIVQWAPEAASDPWTAIVLAVVLIVTYRRWPAIRKALS